MLYNQYPDDPTKLNDEPDGYPARHAYNCAGFALGTWDWYCPGEGPDEWCAEILANDFPDLQRIGSPDDVDALTKVIGFRLGRERHGGWPDFHFLVRLGGEWFEKQGGWLVLPFCGDPYGVWENDQLVYDEPIAWFADFDAKSV